MSLSMVLLAAFLILASISQYFLDWVIFGETGLFVIGLVGLAAGVFMLLEGLGSFNYRVGDRR
jgi:hypothetical protein